jgi:hypothetical protein
LLRYIMVWVSAAGLRLKRLKDPLILPFSQGEKELLNPSPHGVRGGSRDSAAGAGLVSAVLAVALLRRG